MSSIVTLIVYLSAAEATDPASAALAQSAQEVLGDQARITLRAADAAASDAALVSASPPADAVARIVWRGAEHRLASVHCYLARTGQTVAREISFDEEARPKDRERMLGFVVASMLPPEGEVPEKLPPKPEPARAPTVTSEMPASAQPAPLPVHTRFVGMAEVMALGATGVGGSASGIGAEVAGRWLFARSLSLRLSGGLRRGDIPEVSATSEMEFLGLGLAFETPIVAGSPVALGGRASALVLRHELTHLSSDDRTPDRQSRVLPGSSLVFESSWSFSAGAALVAGVGAEVAFGRTDVFSKAQKVVEIPPLRGLAELGIQAKF
jgi:hypothetical protein